MVCNGEMGSIEKMGSRERRSRSTEEARERSVFMRKALRSGKLKVGKKEVNKERRRGTRVAARLRRRRRRQLCLALALPINT